MTNIKENISCEYAEKMRMISNSSLKFMLDTAAYNKFFNNPKYLDLAAISLEYGFSYYKTEPQTWELKGFGAKVYDKECKPVYYNRNATLPDFDLIDSKLNVKYVSCAVNLMQYHTLLDGSAHFISEQSKSGKMFEEILKFDPKTRRKRPFAQHYDALIAESTIYNDCILVTNDANLINLVNKHFNNRAITIEILIDIINDFIKHK